MRKHTVLGRRAVMPLAALHLLGIVSTPVAAQPASKALTTPVPPPAPPPPPPPPPFPPALAAFPRAGDGVTAYRATVTIFEQQAADVQNIVFEYRFRKPSSFLVRVIKGPNAGVTLKGDGGTTVQATRGGGLFAALFKQTLPLHNPLVTTIRGSSIDEL
jgi:hypothetical protein